MDKGTLTERYLENSVIKKINKSGQRPERGCGIGNDYSLSNGICTADGYGLSPGVAWNKALNNYMCSMSRPSGARIMMLLPSAVKESMVKKYMDEFILLSENSGIEIAGGHTEVGDSVNEASFFVTFTGDKSEWSPDKKRITSGCDIVMTGLAGTLGTDIVISKRNDLFKRFDHTYLETNYFGYKQYSIAPVIETIKEKEGNILYIHDISSGGVYSALWQLGKWAGKGLEVHNRMIPISQGTIEICEYLDINPYLIDSTGALLMICTTGHKIVSELKERGINAAVIGNITDSKERVVKFADNEYRTLSPVESDSVYNIKTVR